MKSVIFSLICLIGFTPMILFAQSGPRGGDPAPTQPDPAPRGSDPAPQNDQPGGSLSYSLENPLAFDSIQSFIIAILNIIIVLATPIVVIFIILAGFKYVTARGNASQVQEATQALTYAIIGGVLIIGAVAIAEIIRDLVSAFGT
jgi:Type IV secretion system pilin